MSNSGNPGPADPEMEGYVSEFADGAVAAAEAPKRIEGIESRVLMLLVTLLAALTLRLVAAVVGAGVAWNQLGGDTKGQRLGNTLETLGDFGDGQGVALLLAAVGLALLLERQAQPPGRNRTVWWRWLEALFVVSAAGSVTIIVGDTAYNAGLVGTRFEWSHILATGGFSASYVLIAIAGALFCHIRWDRRTPDRSQRGQVQNPYEQAS